MALEKAYNPTQHEDEVYRTWETSGYFNPDNLPGERPEHFSIVLPPPNVTGVLHMGSALMLVIEDIMIRFERMRGKKTLWIPGTDSAAIATQAKVERDIYKKEKKSRHDVGREELMRRIDAFVEENKSVILRQIRAMGASLDWSRYAYTMDSERYEAVMTAFVRMFDAGLIYRGVRVINWDPKGQTTISDDEIEHEERQATLYTFRYWEEFPILISTTRPETKVGDTAVAVHPEDERYQQYIGKVFSGEFAGVPLEIKVVADPSVEKEFGTGALGVTPAHSQLDAEIAERHQLTSKQVINEYAKMTEAAGPLVSGLKTTEAREKIAEWLRNKGLMEKEEATTQSVSTAQRTGGIIEPLPKLQWFIDVNKEFTLPHSKISGIESGSKTTLKKIMRVAVESDEVKILPDRFKNTYFHWIDNLRDWCISRQIWFGHRIPIWYREEEVYCGTEPPAGEGWEQDPDVLDTWFSASLWTFSTLGWPQDTNDLRRYHPTNIIESGYDILFFWIARMILMSGFHLGEIPFRYVYLHGLVRDEKNRKISKSLGNNIDPMEMGEKYGMDAVRMSLIVGTAAGADSKVSVNKIKAYKHFANKMWNATRFVLMNLEDFDPSKEVVYTDWNKEKLAELAETVQDVTGDIEEFRYHLASEKLYHYFWHTFADILIEETKPRLAGAERAAAQMLLYTILKTLLTMLHPFMPFITEVLWKELPHTDTDAELLMVQPWPNPDNLLPTT